jgi:hypothetical protein
MSLALAAVTRARRELWSFRETPLWGFLTSAIGQAPAEVARIPLLESEELDRELEQRGLDPAALRVEGERIAGETRALGAAKQPAAPPVSPRPAATSRLPSLGGGHWVTLAAVVVATIALAYLSYASCR